MAGILRAKTPISDHGYNINKICRGERDYLERHAEFSYLTVLAYF